LNSHLTERGLQKTFVGNVHVYCASEWAEKSSCLLHDLVFTISSSQGYCNVMLTGGRSAERLYCAWRSHPDFTLMQGVNFYFGDERCVTPDTINSNFQMIHSTLFTPTIPNGCKIFRIHGEAENPKIEAQRYASLLPDSIDILLVGVGADGHIASMFPGDKSWLDSREDVIHVSSSSHPFDRITITSNIIGKSKNVIVLAPGIEKASIYSVVTTCSRGALEIPAFLVADKIWLLDR
jgi:6-phosphogluconolactonase